MHTCSSKDDQVVLTAMLLGWHGEKSSSIALIKMENPGLIELQSRLLFTQIANIRS